MWDYGTGDAHSNAVTYPDDDNLDAFASYTMALHIHLTSIPSGIRYWMRKSGDWQISNNWAESDWDELVQQHQGTISRASQTLTDDTTVSYLAKWSGTRMLHYQDNVEVADNAFAVSIPANAAVLELGGNQSSAGPPHKGGQYMIWRNYELTAAERALYHSGSDIPSIANLTFWVRADAAAPQDSEISGDSGTKVGTVNFFADPSDGYFRPAGGFGFLVAEIFMGALVNRADLFGACLVEYKAKIVRELLNRRCVFDWKKHELEALLEAFRVRRKIV